MCLLSRCLLFFFFFFQAEDGIRDLTVTGVQTCALPICCDPLVGTEEVGVRPSVGEHQVSDDEEAPTVSEGLQGEVDRAVRSPSGALHLIPPPSGAHVTCMMQV